ncbi:MAG TPA: type II toxin-antitoxin system VapC family toxin [Ktedonobacteraceae bacterium]|nr:type II toxin-antitoxin system VapC family toxin [Ktedonobacteraceae bacterium]
MNRVVVVDTSIVLKWVLDEPDSATALALLTKWVNDEIVIQAPALLAYEVANALFQRVRKGEMTAERAWQALEDVLFPELLLNFVEYREISKRAILLAHQYNLPATYDAQYLALAEHEKCDYWTADIRLSNAVKDKLPWVHQLNEYHSSMHN